MEGPFVLMGVNFVIYDSESMAGLRGLALWQAGVELTCPVCDAVLSTIPEGIPRTQMALGLFCPGNKAHVSFYGETASALESVRGVIRKMPRHGS